MYSVIPVPMPSDSAIATSLPRIDYADAYRCRLPGVRCYTLDEAVRLVFATAPAWVKTLLQLRNTLMRPLGLKADPPRPAQTTDGALRPGERLGLFRVFDRQPTELIMGENDRHLDFRVALLLRDEATVQWVTVTTVVCFHNLLGRAYFLVVRPFHQLIVPALMRQALKAAACE